MLGYSSNSRCKLCPSYNICCCSHLLCNGERVKSSQSVRACVNRRHRPSWWCWSSWGWPRMSSLSRRCHPSDAGTSSRHSPKTWTAFSVSWWQFCAFMSRITGKRSVAFYLSGCIPIKSGAAWTTVSCSMWTSISDNSDNLFFFFILFSPCRGVRQGMNFRWANITVSQNACRNIIK